MVSKDPFHIGNSPAVASIPCLECGHNMHCVRREQLAAGEFQQFACVECGAVHERLFTPQESDSEIQRDAERLCGVGERAA